MTRSQLAVHRLIHTQVVGSGLVADASNYFPVFFHFDRYLFSIESELQIAFDWELMGAHFLDRRVDGFTCSIIVNTFYTTSTDTARIHWAEALALLGEYLGDVGPKSADYIYPVDA